MWKAMCKPCELLRIPGMDARLSVITGMCIIFLLTIFPSIDAQSYNPFNKKNATCDPKTDECKPGIIVPVWTPLEVGSQETFFRAFVYFWLFMYAFVGVAIASDRFMAAIEVITSKEREIIIKDELGKKHTVRLKVWNQTVADLTLLALGSSTPEIMLAAIEICQEEFQSEDLGPSTIIGSAAFNLFVITAICCLVIPDGQVKKKNQKLARVLRHLRLEHLCLFVDVHYRGCHNPHDSRRLGGSFDINIFPCLRLHVLCHTPSVDF
jgi:hypothetical protein